MIIHKRFKKLLNPGTKFQSKGIVYQAIELGGKTLDIHSGKRFVKTVKGFFPLCLIDEVL